MLLSSLLVAAFLAPPQPASDADIWSAAITQLRNAELSGRGELVIVPETLPPRSSQCRPLSTPASELLGSLAQRNAAPGIVRDVRLPPNTRIGPMNSMAKAGRPFLDQFNWESFRREFPSGVIVRLSLPAFSEDGTRAIIEYEATGGFDDSRGSAMIFEQKEGRWVVVEYFCLWIT